jgi:ATP-dependent RNA helicase RhlE
MRFDEYSFCPELKRNLAAMGLNRPTDIQYKTIPSVLKGEDVLAIAQTGTGKTAAFAIPAIQLIHDHKSSHRSEGIRCVVMEPTRELAQQVGSVIGKLAAHTRASVFALHGGKEQDEQIRRLQVGIDILVSTPGRLFDLANQGHLKLDRVALLILDEADHMLDLGFIRDIEYVKKLLRGAHQTVFMSATIKPEIKKIAYGLVRKTAIRIQLSPNNPVSRNVSHYRMEVEQDHKRFALEQFLNEHPESRVLVFVRTRVRAERVVKAMARVGIASVALHGEMEQSDRDQVLDQFRKGEHRLMIATDVSARGIDVAGVEFVINYDLPEKPEHYVHRVGRTGRGTHKGTAISYYCPGDKPLLDAIEAFIGSPVPLIEQDKRQWSATVDLMERTSGSASKVFTELETLVAEQGLKTDRRVGRRHRRDK